MILNLVKITFFLKEKREKKIQATENGSKKNRCENNSSATTTLPPEITSWRELKELSTDLNKKLASLLRYSLNLSSYLFCSIA